jgi:hypothetical protein
MAAAALLGWRWHAERAAAVSIEITHPDEMVHADFPPGPAFAWWNNTGKYPPLGYLMLLPFHQEGAAEPYRAADALPYALAWLSALLVAFAVWRLTRSAGAGALAGLLFATTPNILFYAGTLHTEVPYVFWICCALAAAALFHGRAGGVWPCLLATLFLSAAVLTKTQAYPLAVPLLLWCWFRWRAHGRSQLLGLLIGGAAGAALAAALFAWAGTGIEGSGAWDALRGHLEWITGEGIAPYRQHASSPSGWPGLLWSCLIWWVKYAPMPLMIVVFLLLVWPLARVHRPEWRRRHAAALLACVALAAYFLLFLVPIGFVYPRFWNPLWPLLLAAAAAEGYRLVRGRPIVVSIVAALALAACAWSAHLTIRHVEGNPRHAIATEARTLRLLPEEGSAERPAVLPVVGREFGHRYAPIGGEWREVPAVRDWTAERFGRPAEEELVLAGLLPHPFEIALYDPPYFWARLVEVRLPVGTSWGYEVCQEMPGCAPWPRHGALPRYPRLWLFCRDEAAGDAALEAAREGPLTREEAWLVAANLVMPLAPEGDPEAEAAFFRRFGVLWREAALGDPDAPPPPYLEPRQVELVRYLLARAAEAHQAEGPGPP